MINHDSQISVERGSAQQKIFNKKKMKRNKERKKERKSSYLTQNLYRTSLSVPVKKNLEGNSWKTYKTFTVTYK